MNQVRKKVPLEQHSAVDRQRVFHPGTHAHDHSSGAIPARRLVSASGIYVHDDANTFIDGFAGLYCANVGYGREEIAKAVHDQVLELSYAHTYFGQSHDTGVELARQLMDDWLPSGMAKAYFGMSGSDANETLIKICWYYNNVLDRPKKKKIIARHRGYHGSGIVTASLTGFPNYHANFDLPVPGVLHTRCPDYYRREDDQLTESDFVALCIRELEELIQREGADTIAAFIGEPMLGTGGLLPPLPGYWAAVQAVLRKNDILLIADEVVCGFGRLGARTGSELYGIQPDMMTLAKGITSGYVPLSAAVVNKKVWDVIEEGSRKLGAMGHGWTYSGHPVATAAALANLEILKREELIENARVTGAHLQAQLTGTLGDHPLVGNVRGQGLLAAVEVMADRKQRVPFDPSAKIGDRIVDAARKQGLIVRAVGPNQNIIGFAPPLIIKPAEVDDVVARVTRAFDQVAKDVGVQ
ncbi:hypothetical protein APR50_27400 [Variovorax paradoxus]|jgi:L-2,4-diaminobutyrate transaminase|uniref:aminotransferase n=1 Tax=Variovorax paradoxus TaxID=34073 RepID=UPI0006E62597|nr:hypothetical protein APR52_36965 [Variovorax paradoxus]KPV02420.1 hypothetical protein APR50_27400 [Variovorax paradoxus]KPV03723.1 hypothetical protein APR49_25950 [Variovorax paradoxus]KPV18629.1 hypothetical protein APR51_23025 [Variovorax paradoxus]KPV29098.1 hypothetical protein APR48_23590 [Variovorax paradoxus]